MMLDPQLADSAVLEELGRRLAQTRLERNLAQADVAEEAGVGVATVRRLERGHSVASASLIRVLRTLNLLEGLDRAIPEPLASPIEQLKLQGRRRKRAGRARSRGDNATEPRLWRWGDDRAGEI